MLVGIRVFLKKETCKHIAQKQRRLKAESSILFSHGWMDEFGPNSKPSPSDFSAVGGPIS
uniref:Uncharacterized protein n=1 Tax=Rhizophora mucronata TaxID=61149 RepID=A0A2P2QIT6_RHIMU